MAEYERTQAGLPTTDDHGKEDDPFSTPAARPLPRKPKRKGPAFTKAKAKRRKKNK